MLFRILGAPTFFSLTLFDMEVIKIQIVLTTCKPEVEREGGFEIEINSGLFVQKRLYTTETIRGIRISPSSKFFLHFS